ncbi:MAG TPA: hypothetical protein VK447_01715 [Myxococcaceae bacterium]|nr:hypothetical protein [Myxococcaceae bacterium]
MKAHGGYFCRLEALDARVVRLAREAFEVDGGTGDGTTLRVSVIPRRRVVRLAYETPELEGEAGARWYEGHHALPRMLSRELNVTVHSYVLMPDEFEQVTAYGAGRRVGGELLRYDDVDIPGCGETMSDADFEKLKSRWPLGHLAYVFGVPRAMLLGMASQQCYRVALQAGDPEELANVLPPPAA